MSEDQPTGLLDIAVRRASHDRSTPMLFTPTGGDFRAVTYCDVLGAAIRLSAALRAAGVRRGDRVGCYLSNSPSWVVASLAVWLNEAAVGAVGTLVPGPEATALFDLAETRVVIAAGGCVRNWLTQSRETQGCWRWPGAVTARRATRRANRRHGGARGGSVPLCVRLQLRVERYRLAERLCSLGGPVRPGLRARQVVNRHCPCRVGNARDRRRASMHAPASRAPRLLCRVPGSTHRHVRSGAKSRGR